MTLSQEQERVTYFEMLPEAQRAAERHHRAQVARAIVESWNARAQLMAARLLDEAGR